MWNPKDGEFYVADEFYNEKNPRKIENFDTWLNDIAEANNVPLKTIPGIKSKYAGSDGKLKWMNPVSKEAVRDLRVKEHNVDLEDELTSFRMNPKENISLLKRGEEVAGITDLKYEESRLWGPKVKFKYRGSNTTESMTPAEFEQLIRSKMIK
jgi:hypothetical protein